MTSNSAGLDLQATVDRFCALEQRAANISPSELYHVALSHLHEICSARCHFIRGNAVLLARSFPGDFDLVLAGGLFDYLEDRNAAHLIRTIYQRQLRAGGRFFTNIVARGNSFRCLIEYMGDWSLIERSEEDILRLCRQAGVPVEAVSIRTDESGLALLVDVTQPRSEP